MWNGIDKRRFPRANYKCTITIRRLIGSEVIHTQTENIGVGGICVFLDKELKLFEEVGLGISIDNGKSHIECRGRIVWQIKRKDFKDKIEFFDTGIEFIDISDHDKATIEMVVEEVISKLRAVT